MRFPFAFLSRAASDQGGLIRARVSSDVHRWKTKGGGGRKRSSSCSAPRAPPSLPLPLRTDSKHLHVKQTVVRPYDVFTTISLSRRGREGMLNIEPALRKLKNPKNGN